MSFAGWTGTSNQWFSFIKDASDMLLREGAKHPKMMSVGLHMRLIGHPARAAGLERLLDYMMKQEGVWITRRLDIARHWIIRLPRHCSGPFLRQPTTRSLATPAPILNQ